MGSHGAVPAGMDNSNATSGAWQWTIERIADRTAYVVGAADSRAAVACRLPMAVFWYDESATQRVPSRPWLTQPAPPKVMGFLGGLWRMPGRRWANDEIALWLEVS
jgi:hypothetical protein